MIGDLVGFFNPGGYLGSFVQSWITFFPFMSAVDAFLLADGNNFNQSDLSLPWATPEAAEFVVNAGDWYRTNFKSDFPQYNVTQVLHCIDAWQQTQSDLLSMAQQLQGPSNPTYYKYSI